MRPNTENEESGDSSRRQLAVLAVDERINGNSAERGSEPLKEGWDREFVCTARLR